MRSQILLSGADGQLGWELQRSLSVLGEVTSVARAQLDLSDAGAIRRVVQGVRPTLFVNAAAYTAVDRAETDREQAFAVNAFAVAVLAAECRRLGARLVHFSTDYVFDGTASRPYTEDDAACPTSVYGVSKLAGEHAIIESGVEALCFRTSWVYAARGRNFLRTMLRLAREGRPLRVVDDQRGCPTWARALAEATLVAVIRDAFSTKAPVYHLAGGGDCTWFEFASRLFELEGRVVDLTPIPTSAYPTPAMRPAYSVLSCDRAFRDLGIRLPHWEESLRQAEPSSMS